MEKRANFIATWKQFAKCILAWKYKPELWKGNYGASTVGGLPGCGYRNTGVKGEGGRRRHS
jgi:hypothetical protein